MYLKRGEVGPFNRGITITNKHLTFTFYKNSSNQDYLHKKQQTPNTHR